MEMAAQMEQRNVKDLAEWAPRELNQEADDLTNLKFEEFSASLRIDMRVDQLPLLVLPDLMKEAMAFYGEVKSSKGLRRAAAEPQVRGQGREAARPLREREPW
jgi:hypothetical protein